MCVQPLLMLFTTQADLQVNRMCHSLTTQVRSIGSVTTAVARGDLSKMIEIEAEGEMAVLKNVSPLTAGACQRWLTRQTSTRWYGN